MTIYHRMTLRDVGEFLIKEGYVKWDSAIDKSYLDVQLESSGFIYFQSMRMTVAPTYLTGLPTPECQIRLNYIQSVQLNAHNKQANIK